MLQSIGSQSRIKCECLAIFLFGMTMIGCAHKVDSVNFSAVAPQLVVSAQGFSSTDPKPVSPIVNIEQSPVVKKAIETNPKVISKMLHEQQRAHQKISGWLSEINAYEPSIAAWEDSIRKANGWDQQYVYDRSRGQWLYYPLPTDHKYIEVAK